MIIETAQFGQIKIDEDQVITFAHGLPGFEDVHRFAIVHPDEQSPFCFLQAIDRPNLSFVLTNPFLFHPSYEFELADAVKEELKITDSNQVAVWSIVTVKQPITESTMNLLAPVVINTSARRGKQIILHGTTYAVKHPLKADDPSRTESKGDAHARIKS